MNVMDRKTRFLIASKLTEDRESKSAIMAFQEAVKNTHGSEPFKIYTDSLRSYEAGVSETFHRYIRHVAQCGVNKPHSNNNRIERMNGTLRERVKVQRGWKKKDTPLAEGMRIQYNFVKPHMALKGKTPSEECGVGIKANNKWLALIKNATNYKKTPK